MELSIPDRVADEDWLCLLRDCDVKVRSAAALRAPAHEEILQEFLRMLVKDPEPEIKMTAALRLPMKGRDSLETMARLAGDKKIDACIRRELARRLNNAAGAGEDPPDLQPVAACLVAEEDFRLRQEGYRMLGLLGHEISPSQEDMLLLELPEIAEGKALDLGRRLAGRGPSIVPALIEALTDLSRSEPLRRVKESCLRGLGAEAVLPMLIAMIEESDMERAADAALALGSLAPDLKAWQTLLDLWQGERNDTVRYAMLIAACSWPTWRSGSLLLRTIESDYSIRLKRDAIRLATNKGVPGLAGLALRILLNRECLPLVNDLFQALVKLYANRAIPLELLEKWLDESDPATASLMWDVKETAEKMKESRGEEEEKEADPDDLLRLDTAWEDDG